MAAAVPADSGHGHEDKHRGCTSAVRGARYLWRRGAAIACVCLALELRDRQNAGAELFAEQS